jgi:glucose/galactose transporter
VSIFTEKKMNQTFRISPIYLIAILFFIFGIITWVNGTLIPYLKIACELTDAQVFLVTFAFYIAYFFMAIPSTYIIELTGYKKSMSIGMIVLAMGALIFIPAAYQRNFYIFLIGLFMQGIGLALLQTASNPYITILGPIESAAQRISIMGIGNKIAGAIASVVLANLVLKDTDLINEKIKHISDADKNILLNELSLKVVNPYLILTLSLFVLAIILWKINLPEPALNNETSPSEGNNNRSFFSYTYLFIGVFALFAYVGAEVIAGDTIINYGINFWKIKIEYAKYFTAMTLSFMIIGYLLGVVLIPKYVSQQKMLTYCSLSGIIFTLGIMFTTSYVSIACVALLGLSNSLVWPAIWPLALDKLGKYTKTGSALLIMAIAGGAILPLIYGSIIEENILNAQYAYIMLVPCYLLILFFSTIGYQIGKKA